VMKEFKTFMNDYLPTVKESVDGLIFTPVNEQVRMGTHETMFKWKPKEKNTIDFLAKVDARGVWRLYVQEKGKLYLEGEIPPDKADDIPILENGAILECMYMERDTPMWWKPLLKREDKDYPNNRRTFYRTLVNITEDIKMTDFLRCI
jgi:mRNA guanylyltransferase